MKITDMKWKQNKIYYYCTEPLKGQKRDEEKKN